MINQQIETYRQLHDDQQSTRRENQRRLIEPLEELKKDVYSALKTDKLTFETARDQFEKRYNRLQRLFAPSASKHRSLSVQPLKTLYDERHDLAVKVTDLLQQTLNECEPLEVRSRWNGSVAVVYDPRSGRAEWREYHHGGIHGVYNPQTRTIEWEEAFGTGIYGVFNPQLNFVEWKRAFQGGVHGVYNPALQTVEWHVSFHSGVAGVYNPLSREVEWKTSMRGGVVGYFDHQSQTVKWIEKWHHGLALIVWDPHTQSYLTSSSCGWYGA